ncbi:hypothetical protein SB85_20240 (plasmid) [Xanthomonas sacchari]|nr:hypothetical protein SB85_20240 [Xanthomonas sacchari]
MRHVRNRPMPRAAACLAIGLSTLGLAANAAPATPYVDLAAPFEKAAIETAGQPEEIRIAQIRSRINAMVPGVYPAGTGTDKRIGAALHRFSVDREDYDRVVADFPIALNGAIARFQHVFPGFVSPLPIYLYHSLGQRDGGSDYLQPGHRHVMLFGADMIAEYHADDSLEPFLIHELFHLEHARHFADCDPLWCTLWQEGLAVEATATLVPHATDHQLLLDIPAPIRAPTDRRWSVALCFVAAHFDDRDGAATASALQKGGHPPDGLPDRFGYYVGLRLAQATGLKITELSRLDNKAARALARAALRKLMTQAHATCPAPAVVRSAVRQQANGGASDGGWRPCGPTSIGSHDAPDRDLPRCNQEVVQRGIPIVTIVPMQLNVEDIAAIGPGFVKLEDRRALGIDMQGRTHEGPLVTHRIEHRVEQRAKAVHLIRFDVEGDDVRLRACLRVHARCTASFASATGRSNPGATGSTALPGERVTAARGGRPALPAWAVANQLMASLG